MAYCKKCRITVGDDNAFCMQCGEKLTYEKKRSVVGSAFSTPVLSGEEYTEQETFAHEAAKTETTLPVRKRISAISEFKLLLGQGIRILIRDRRNLLISLLFPFIAAAITVWISGEDMFLTYEATNSSCFILVCAAIWGGLFNSIQSVVKERKIIKRNYVSGAMRIGCYVTSRAVIQLVLCLFQSFVLSMTFPMVAWVYGNSLPVSGLCVNPLFLEFYASLFLIMMASDALGLLISSIVKKEELASKLAPYILIAQLLFSGVLFELKGAANYLSGIMISRWGMEALGSICNLNATNTSIYTQMVEQGFTPGSCPCGILSKLQLCEFQDCFKSTGTHFLIVLGIMALFVLVPLLLSNFMLRKVKNDSRD